MLSFITSTFVSFIPRKLIQFLWWPFKRIMFRRPYPRLPAPPANPQRRNQTASAPPRRSQGQRSVSEGSDGSTVSNRSSSSSPAVTAAVRPASETQVMSSQTGGGAEGGDSDRRTALNNRYWRFREWARHSALNVPTDGTDDDDENPFLKRPLYRQIRSAQVPKDLQLNKPKEPKLPEPSPDDPPGFRWVYVEIV